MLDSTIENSPVNSPVPNDNSTSPTITPLPEQSGSDVPDANSDKRTVFALMPLATLGLLLAILAVLTLLWPTGNWGEDNVQYVHHLDRITGSFNGQMPANTPRAILDIAFYVVLIVGIGFIVRGWLRGTRGAFLGMMGVAILGLSYVSGMVLYTGPMFTACGFTLLLFGGMVMLAISRDQSERATVHDEPVKTNNESVADKIDTEPKFDAESEREIVSPTLATTPTTIESGTDAIMDTGENER